MHIFHVNTKLIGCTVEPLIPDPGNRQRLEHKKSDNHRSKKTPYKYSTYSTNKSIKTNIKQTQ